jgi:hypothetical protein
VRYRVIGSPVILIVPAVWPVAISCRWFRPPPCGCADQGWSAVCGPRRSRSVAPPGFGYSPVSVLIVMVMFVDLVRWCWSGR